MMAQRHQRRREREQAGTGRQMEAVSSTNTYHLGAWAHPSADDLDGDSFVAERWRGLLRYRVVRAIMEGGGGPHGQTIPWYRTP